jgi:hypothetical protein
MKAGARARLPVVTAVALAACLWATEDCMLVAGDGDYHVGATAALAGCTETATTATCPTGALCVAGLCEASCASDADCQTNWRCIAAPDQASTTAGNVCMPHCNPMTPQQPDDTHVACDSTDICVVNFLAALPFTDCVGVVPGTQGQGQTCADVTECLAGYNCLPVTGGVCLQYCLVGQSDCGAGLTCTSLAPPFFDGQKELGTCAP